MNRLSVTSCALALAFAAAPANATPPDIIHVQDQLFATAVDIVFVLRSVHDNLGLHSSLYRETWLVGIDVGTGTETTWLIYRGRRDMVFSANPEDERIAVTALDQADWHDPMQIIGDANAELVLGEAHYPALGDALSADAEGRFVIASDHWPQISWQRDQTLDRAQASIARLAAQTAEAQRMAPVTTQELWAMREVEWDSCAYQRGTPRGVGTQVYQVIRMNCESTMTGEVTSLMQVVTPS